jgi:DNA-directed RNA polymerase subunit RPC12/RpoP
VYLFFLLPETNTENLLAKCRWLGVGYLHSQRGWLERKEMSSNYPEGSMRGSGIYAQDYTGVFYCDTCEDEFELDGSTDDWQSNAYADCPKCGQQLEVELPSRDERDEDADYDAWRESQMD